MNNRARLINNTKYKSLPYNNVLNLLRRAVLII
jgi:hypothetical protein